MRNRAFVCITLILVTYSIGSAGGWAKSVHTGKNIKAEPRNTSEGNRPEAGVDSILPQDGKRVADVVPGSMLRTIVIDPGHGGHDPGCSGAYSKEKKLVLSIAQYFATNLRNNYPDLRVLMTRTKDVFIPLHERAAMATREQADLFVSIHCNFIPKAGHIQGMETYVLGLHATEANLEVAKRENEAILLEDNYEETYGYDPNSPEAHIVLSMFQNVFLDNSIRFAEQVQAAAAAGGRGDRGVRQAGFLVLRHATMPSVLVETGYLSNRKEEAYLASDDGQRELANALLLAFDRYKQALEGSPAQAELRLLPLSGQQADVPVADAEVPAGTGTAAPSTPRPVLTSFPDKGSRTEPTGQGTADALEYRVQLLASPVEVRQTGEKWSRLTNLVEVRQEDNYYKYQVCNLATEKEARRVKEQVRSAGFHDAFIVTYRNGRRSN